VNPDLELGNVLRRIASATSTIRTRTQDEQRRVTHGATNGEREEVVRALVLKLSAVAEQLEKALA
jgi:hypothetical protein